MARLDELRLMAKVARMYYRDGLRQVQITERLNIHQSTVSRLLKRAEKEGIVRMTLTMPSGLHPELEEPCRRPTACAKRSSSTPSIRRIRSFATSAPRRPSISRPR